MASVAPRLMQRIFLSAAAFTCGAACAIAAYASHVADAVNAKRLLIATAFMLAHALTYFALHRYARWIEFLARLLLIFALLFSFSLLSAAFFQWRPLLAPYAGGGLIISWVVLGAVFLFTKSGEEN